MTNGLVEALSFAVSSGADQLRPGSMALRDLEKATAFAGASLAAGGASGYEVAALLLALRDAVLEHTELELTRPDWALGFRFDIVLGGRDATPLEEPHDD